MIRTVASVPVIALLVLATPVAALDRVALYTDPAMSDCDLDDTTVGLKSVYIGHSTPSGATGSQFRVPTPACWNGGMFLSGTPAPGMAMFGNIESDVIFSYGTCYAGSFVIGTIHYFSNGQGTPCCEIQVLKAPTAPLDGVVATDCALTPGVTLVPFPIVINTDLSCYCYNPVHNTTWGQIKSLYSQQ